jgi:hypothetical protein
MLRKLTRNLLFVALAAVMFSFLHCDHNPFDYTESPVAPPLPTPTPTPTPEPTPEPTPTPTPSPDNPDPDVSPTPTPEPTPTPTPSPTPTPTPVALTGLWSGSYNDNTKDGDENCDLVSGSLELDISHDGSNITVAIQCDNNPHLDPLGDGSMVVEGTVTENEFSCEGRLVYDYNREPVHTDVELEGTADGDTLSGIYRGTTCYETSGICFCFKVGEYTVTR